MNGIPSEKKLGRYGWHVRVLRWNLPPKQNNSDKSNTDSNNSAYSSGVISLMYSCKKNQLSKRKWSSTLKNEAYKTSKSWYIFSSIASMFSSLTTSSIGYI